MCSKCQINPRAARGSWCTACRREAQRAYNTRTRRRPEIKTSNCIVCSAEITWTSGQGPDRVYCSTKCKRAADTAVQIERRREGQEPVVANERRQRQALREQGLRRCNKCETVKPLDAYHRRGVGHQHRCITCTAEWGRANVRTARLSSWRSHLKTRFGLTALQWDRMLFEQSGRCYLCEEPMLEPHVDHDHACCPGHRTCGECIRGLACQPCNVAIGNFDDDSDRMHLVADRLAARKAELRRATLTAWSPTP